MERLTFGLEMELLRERPHSNSKSSSRVERPWISSGAPAQFFFKSSSRAQRFHFESRNRALATFSCSLGFVGFLSPFIVVSHTFYRVGLLAASLFGCSAFWLLCLLNVLASSFWLFGFLVVWLFFFFSSAFWLLGLFGYLTFCLLPVGCLAFWLLGFLAFWLLQFLAQ